MLSGTSRALQTGFFSKLCSHTMSKEHDFKFARLNAVDSSLKWGYTAYKPCCLESIA